MNIFLELPFVLQALVIYLVGLIVAGQLNRAIYRWSWPPRPVGPWNPPAQNMPPRRASDYLPVWGWWVLRREAARHGPDYWMRPLLLELITPAALVFLFWWESSGQLLPSPPPQPAAVAGWQFLAHAFLFCALIVATFIDFDTQEIPDNVTVPGTLIGLCCVTLQPAALLPAGAGATVMLPTPHAWDPRWMGTDGLVLGWACYAGWCLALLPKTWWPRQGWARAIRLLWASTFRRGGKMYWGLALIGSPIVAWVWQRGGPAWQGLLTGLVGMAFGGGMVWLVRLVAQWGLGREGMGFGDVTLMAMIGSFLGWQAAVLIFFVAPFAGAVIALLRFLVTRQSDIAYGPFLSAATLTVVLFWADIWNRWGPVFELGYWIGIVFLVCMLPMGILLRMIAWGQQRH